MPLDTNMKVLIVDDFSTMRRIVRNLLRQMGFNDIEEAEDGQQAFNTLQNRGFDFIICDWNMPNLDGLGLLKKIRDDKHLNHLPILMVTAESEKERVISAIQAGVNNYIVKPFTAEVLREKLYKIFEKAPV